jgi:hypothetical protein
MLSNDARRKEATKSLNNNLFRVIGDHNTSVAFFDDDNIDYMA